LTTTGTTETYAGKEASAKARRCRRGTKAPKPVPVQTKEGTGGNDGLNQVEKGGRKKGELKLVTRHVS